MDSGAILQAIYDCDFSVMEAHLLTHDIDAMVGRYGTMLHYAAILHNEESMQFLLSRGADVNQWAKGSKSRPMESCIDHSRNAKHDPGICARMLLSAGASLYYVNGFRRGSLLSMCKNAYNLNIAKQLIDFGATTEPYLSDAIKDFIVIRERVLRQATLVLCCRNHGSYFCRDVLGVIAKHLFTFRINQ